MTESTGKCVRCDYSQAGEVEKKRALASLVGFELSPLFFRTMLLVDKHVLDPEGQWGAWQGSKFVRGGGRSGDEPYWVCGHCHAPGEAILEIVKKPDEEE